MKKSDILNLVLGVVTAINPAAGAAASVGAASVAKLIKRDDYPSNDLDEVSDALTEIVMATVMGLESVTKKDYVNDPLLAQLAANIKGDIKLVMLVVNKAPAPLPVPAPPAPQE